MRILHISDLHFGKHDTNLQSDLKRRVEDLRPDVIVCTGDVANQPSPGLLADGLDYLDRLAQGEDDKQRGGGAGTPEQKRAAELIPLIVVPGNHDYRWSGFLSKSWAPAYKEAFAGRPTSGFYKSDSADVWVFGFDSAALGEFGGSGQVDAAEIERFHAEYDRLKRSDARFEPAFKIAALHHHPLPVARKGDSAAKWLTLVNSGQFLTAILFRKIDLVLHGHEHLQAQAELWSTLGGDNRHRIAVSSLGATLRTMTDEEKKNWFSIVTVERNQVKADFYSNVGQAWSETPTATAFVIRSDEASAQLDWEREKKQRGYYYRELASLTTVDEDGDALRAVECSDLTILGQVDRRISHSITLPPSSGVLTRLRAHWEDGQRIQVEGAPPSKRGKRWDAKLVFNPVVNRQASYTYKWNALNSFAMDERQFDYQYSRDAAGLDNTEYTHYEVKDPVEELTVVVQFPRGFSPAMRPSVLVSTPDAKETDSRKWQNASEIQAKLQESHALHFYPSLNVAALRVRRPAQQLCYGIQWKVPGTGHAAAYDLRWQTLQESAKYWKKLSPANEAKILRTMWRIIVATRDSFLGADGGEGWPGPVGASIMHFDGQHMLEVVMAALHPKPGSDISGAQYPIKLRYGDGIAGRAFKANRFRVYVAPDGSADDDEVPDYYMHFEGSPDFKIVVALPLHVPESDDVFATNPRIYESKRPYGVLNIDSERSDSPLALLRNIENMPEVLAFQHWANQLIYGELTSLS